METNNIQEAKKEMLRNYNSVLNELIFERYRILSVISAIAFALLGISIPSFNDSLMKSKSLALLSIAIIIGVALIGLGRYIFLTRKDIEKISQKEKESQTKDLTQPLKIKKCNQDYWVEILYIFLIIAILIFILSFVDFRKIYDFFRDGLTFFKIRFFIF